VFVIESVRPSSEMAAGFFCQKQICKTQKRRQLRYDPQLATGRYGVARRQKWRRAFSVGKQICKNQNKGHILFANVSWLHYSRPCNRPAATSFVAGLPFTRISLSKKIPPGIQPDGVSLYEAPPPAHDTTKGKHAGDDRAGLVGPLRIGPLRMRCFSRKTRRTINEENATHDRTDHPYPA